MTQTEISNIGPIEHITIPVPEKGGIVVFRGRNGSGKSTALEAIDAAVAGRGKPPVRDGQVAGEVIAHGVTLTIGRSKRRKGEAEVSCLEGRLSVADLVDPGIQDPERADAHRIKALVTLSGVETDVALFSRLVLGVRVAIPESVLEQTDLVSMAAAFKRWLEAEARRHEDMVESARVKAQTERQHAGEVDLTIEHDADKLQASLEKAIQLQAAQKADAANRMDAIDAAAVAGKQLEDARKAYDGPDLKTAVGGEDAASEAVLNARTALQKVEADLAKRYADRLRAQTHHDAIGAWEASIDAAKDLVPINDHEIAAAESKVSLARFASERGMELRIAIKAREHADQIEAGGAEAAKEAEALRDSASGTEEILSKVVGRLGVALRVEPVDQRMRLVLDTDRGNEPFGELSPGERWRVAIDIAVKALGEGGELTIPQGAWEGLDPPARVSVAKQLEAAGIIAYTAEASDGPLRAERFEP